MSAARGSHANYPHSGTHGRFLGIADDHNDQAGVTWNARAQLVQPWPPRLMRFGGRLSKHVVNVWQQVCAGLDFSIKSKISKECGRHCSHGRNIVAS